tara:strand:+ start:369 stop:518 length:150 start_codon:yes stop_codon:yes gene_type:complete
MNKKQLKDRIKYLKTELAHEGYHDGWVLMGMKKELKELEGELKDGEHKS